MSFFFSFTVCPCILGYGRSMGFCQGGRRMLGIILILLLVWAGLVVLLVFLLWIAPQQFFRFPPRLLGFDPDTFAAAPALYWSTLGLRFLRLVIIVPLVEEIFWRGFFLRILIAEQFETLPFGTFSWLSFAFVTIAFGFSHSMADWPVALITGALYNFVAYRTKSLSSCVLAHGLTNLALGLWIVTTKQWGFW